MLRKIILPLVLLIFAQQDFYGMEEIKVGEEAQVGIWKTINNCINKDISRKDGKVILSYGCCGLSLITYHSNMVVQRYGNMARHIMD